MGDRCLEIRLPAETTADLGEVLKPEQSFWVWQNPVDGAQLHRIILPAEEVEVLLDAVQSRCSGIDGFKVVVLPVEASLPRPQPEELSAEDQALAAAEKASKSKRIAREELLSDLNDAVGLDSIFNITVVLSTVLACIGLSRGSSTIIIGAMVIAPLLGPNMAMALATALGDRALMWRSARTNLTGVSLALGLAMLYGLIFPAHPEQAEIVSRTVLLPTDLLLGLASGAAGALAFTSGVSASLVGVMVAVALLPPLATCGILLVNGYYPEAGAAALLVWANVVCVNLAAVGVFLAQGVRPRTWWEKRKSVRLSHGALVFWGGSLALALYASWE
jgi:uncharacterized hydrophobic protein (TIGR00341 family)